MSVPRELESPGCGPGPGSLSTQTAPGAWCCPCPVHAPHPGLRVGLGLCSRRAVHSSPCFQTLRCPPACWSFRSKLRHGWMSGENLMIMRIQRTAPEAIGETEATQLGKDGKCWGDLSRRFFHRCRVPFFLYNKQDSQHSGSCSREGRATGSGGGSLSPSQKDPETGLGRRCICANFLTHLFKK